MRPWRFERSHSQVSVPNLDFTGWFDHCISTIKHLTTLQRVGATDSARNQSKIVIGPWNHGGYGKRALGEFDFGAGAILDQHQEIIRWFDFWLKGHDNDVDAIPPVRYFVMGSGEWKNAESWPPAGYRPVEFCLGMETAKGAQILTLERDCSPRDTNEASYTYDPVDPVPTLWSRDLYSVPGNRRRLDYRQDILRYRSAQLSEPLEIAGDARVELYVSCTTPDTDLFARLVDEPPEGPALEITYGVVRARHRHSLQQEDFLVAGEITKLEISLGPTASCFLPGHRIRLEITSSDFPSHDRNHNTGNNDIFDATLQTAQITIHHGPGIPSRLILPVR